VVEINLPIMLQIKQISQFFSKPIEVSDCMWPLVNLALFVRTLYLYVNLGYELLIPERRNDKKGGRVTIR
jgi:hypothetical protein